MSPRALSGEKIAVEETTSETEILGKEPPKKKSKFLPFLGANNLKPNEPRFFVNGRKLIRVIKTLHGYDDDKKPCYKIERSLFRIIFDQKKEGQVMRQQLRTLGIPGA